MENLNGLANIFSNLASSIPFNYVLLIVGIMALAIVWGKQKLGLMAVAGVFFLWAFENHSAGLVETFQASSIGVMASLSIVLTMSVLVVMVFMDESH